MLRLLSLVGEVLLVPVRLALEDFLLLLVLACGAVFPSSAWASFSGDVAGLDTSASGALEVGIGSLAAARGTGMLAEVTGADAMLRGATGVGSVA